MGAVTKHSIRVYTALAELRGDNEDILDALIPFFEPVLEVMNGNVFNPKLLSAGVRKIYKWKFTPEIAERFIPRLVNKGYLVRDGSKNDAIYVVRFQPPPPLQIEADINVALRGIVSNFQLFTKTVFQVSKYKRSDDELTDILIRFLVSSEAFGSSSLYFPADNEVDNFTDEAASIGRLEEGGRPLSDEDKFVAARFVKHLVDTDSDYVKYLSRLASIGLLTEIADEFLKPTNIPENVDLTIVLDTPIVFDYLGLSGKDSKENAELILNSLKSIGCKLMVFNTTCAEMQRALQSMLRLPPPSRRGQTHQAMIRQEVLPDFVNNVARNPDRIIAKSNINISQMETDNFPALHQYFDEDRRNDFWSYISWNQESARDHDADCMTLLMRLRQGKKNSDLFKCGYVFVTRNPAFARKARSYSILSRLMNEWQEAPVIHLTELATVAWLRTGFGGADAIPRAYLVASCERVLRIRPEVCDAVAAKIKSITPDMLHQYETLLLDSRSVNRLADETMNDENIVTADNAFHLLDVMRQAVIETEIARHKVEIGEVEARFNSEREAERVSNAKKIEELQSEMISRISSMEDKINEREALALRASEEQREVLKISQLEREKLKRIAEEERQSSLRQRKAIVEGIMRKINKFNLLIELAIYLFLGGWVIVAIYNQYTNFLDGNRYWEVAVYTVVVFGIYRSLMAFISKPTLGVTNMLNLISRLRLQRELRNLGVDWISIEEFSIKDGRILQK